MTLGAFCNTISFIFDYDSGHIGKILVVVEEDERDRALRTQISDPRLASRVSRSPAHALI